MFHGCPVQGQIPANVRAWFQAYGMGADEASYTEKRRMTPILFEAVTLIGRVKREEMIARAELART